LLKLKRTRPDHAEVEEKSGSASEGGFRKENTPYCQKQWHYRRDQA